MTNWVWIYFIQSMNWVWIYFIMWSAETGGYVGLTTTTKLTVKPGESITIPCLYHSTFKLHKKYWCYRSTFYYCNILTTANNTKDKVTVTDYPEYNFFTATMRDLHPSKDYTNYWCAVSMSSTSPYDDMKEISITFQSGKAHFHCEVNLYFRHLLQGCKDL